jgi:hypothetical protein
LITLVIGALTMLGTACQPVPDPQMKLTLHADLAATYEIQTTVVTINVQLTCTRPHGVRLGAEILGPWGYVNETFSETVQCPGPAGGAFALKWQWGYGPPGEPVPMRITATTSTLETFPYPPYSLEHTPQVDLARASDGGMITFRHIFCWPGTAICWSA